MVRNRSAKEHNFQRNRSRRFLFLLGFDSRGKVNVLAALDVQKCVKLELSGSNPLTIYFSSIACGVGKLLVKQALWRRFNYSRIQKSFFLTYRGIESPSGPPTKGNPTYHLFTNSVTSVNGDFHKLSKNCLTFQARLQQS